MFVAGLVGIFGLILRRILTPLLTRLAGLAIILVTGLAIGSCSTQYATFIKDAATNPPKIETIRAASGEQIDLYSIDIGPEPRQPLFFVSGSGGASLSYFLRASFEGMTGSWTVYAAQKAGVSRSETGLSCSQTFADNYYFEAMRDRYNAALREVISRHGEIAAVLGVSEGGEFAALLAQANPQVRRLAVIGSCGVSWRKLGAMIDARKGNDTFSRTFAEAATDPMSTTKKALGYPYRYWSSVVDFAPRPFICP